MTDKRPSDNAKPAKEQNKVRPEDSQEPATGNLPADKVPGKGKPDKQEGVGTVQNQKR
jgi:hypothetical protein